MRVSEIRKEKGVQLEDSIRVSARVDYDDPRLESEIYWYEFPKELEEHISEAGDAWLIVLLPLAFTINEPITLDRPVDPFLLENAFELLDAWKFWHPQLSRIEIHAPIGEYQEKLVTRNRNAQFFSGGVDSFFTALRHGPEDPRCTDDLIFCWGFDVPLTNVDAITRLKDSLMRSTDKLHKNLIIVATNIRETQFGKLDWAHTSHGCAMASAGLHLEPLFQRLLIPSSDGYLEAEAYGSHAFTDHLFSTSNMHVIHDGSAFSRQQKTDLIAKYPETLDELRVCWQTFSDNNCGCCEKCIRTMIDLELNGVLSEISTFNHTQIDHSKIRRIYTSNKENGIPLYYEQMLSRAQEQGHDDLSKSLKICLNRSKIYEPLFNLFSILKKFTICYRLTDFVEKRIRKTLIY